MQTAYVLRGHLDAEGVIVLDEPAPLPPGPVLITVLPDEHVPSGAGYTPEEHAELWNEIDAIGALEGPLPPQDGLSAKDADTILYGTDIKANDVH